jgi:CrcB protein
MIKQVLLIGFGGFAGSVARYYVSKLNLSYEVLAIPIGTLTVNILGSLLIGFLTGIAEKSPIMTADLRLLLMVGLCGGFTTFSTFTNENLMLLHNGQFLTIFLYTGLSIMLGFIAVYLGFTASNLL